MDATALAGGRSVSHKARSNPNALTLLPPSPEAASVHSSRRGDTLLLLPGFHSFHRREGQHSPTFPYFLSQFSGIFSVSRRELAHI